MRFCVRCHSRMYTPGYVRVPAGPTVPPQTHMRCAVLGRCYDDVVRAQQAGPKRSNNSNTQTVVLAVVVSGMARHLLFVWLGDTSHTLGAAARCLRMV